MNNGNLLNNLKDRTPEERKNLAIKAGIASGKARRLKKYLKNINIKVVNRFEIDFMNGLEILLSGIDNNITLLRQFCVDRYRIDCYIPEYNIAIEYDEEGHKYKKECDKKRELDIEKNIKISSWIRVLKGNEFEGYSKIINTLLINMGLKNNLKIGE